VTTRRCVENRRWLERSDGVTMEQILSESDVTESANSWSLVEKVIHFLNRWYWRGDLSTEIRCQEMIAMICQVDVFIAADFASLSLSLSFLSLSRLHLFYTFPPTLPRPFHPLLISCCRSIHQKLWISDRSVIMKPLCNQRIIWPRATLYKSI
jgi:hypothetical protein